MCRSGAAARGTNLQGMQRRHRNNRKYGANELSFPHAETFLRKLSEIWTRFLKIFVSPVLGRKSLNNIGFGGGKIYKYARSAHMSLAGPVPLLHYSNDSR